MPDLVEEINHPEVIFVPEREGVFDYLMNVLEAGDLVLVLTAGDAIEINDQLEKALSH
jgi:UDP-N-acetylmuramate-alanine ligase